MVVRDARYSRESYALKVGGGDRECCWGFRFFAIERDTTVGNILEKFSASPRCLAVTVGELRFADYPVVRTGTAPNHFAIQLVGGIAADVPARFVDDGELASKGWMRSRGPGHHLGVRARLGGALPSTKPTHRC